MKQQEMPRRNNAISVWIKNNKLKSIGAAVATFIAVTAGMAEVSGYSVRDILESVNANANKKDPPTSASILKSGWGPDRPVFPIASGGAPYPAYNCIVDNVNYGDERNFATVRDVTKNSEGEFRDVARVIDGHAYEIRILINNCGPDRDIEAKSSWIQDARLAIVPSTGTREEHFVTVYLSGSNATKVWDNIKFESDEPFRFIRVADGVKLYSNAHPIPGIDMDESVFSSYGTPIGYEDMDGNIRPGYQYATYIYARLVARG